MSRIRRGTNSLFLLAVSAALAFGATQAVAAPGAQACTKIYYGVTCSAGVTSACASYCQSLGFSSSTCADDPLRPRSCCTCR